MDTFLQRVSSGKSPSPAMVSHALQSGVGGINICEEPILHGNNETIQRKKTSKLHNSSHKLGYVMESRKRKQKGRPRKISFGSPPNVLVAPLMQAITLQMRMMLFKLLMKRVMNLLLEQKVVLIVTEQGKILLQRMMSSRVIGHSEECHLIVQGNALVL